ncbi:MAG: methyltransferase domain-containing protein [Candidatus Thermoplasmatota archaeon]
MRGKPKLTPNEFLAKRIEWRRIRLRDTVRYAKPGKIIEFGCGKGLVLQILSEKFPESVIVGVDISKSALKEADKIKLKNVALIQANILDKIFINNSFDSCLFIGSLHEIYSQAGKKGVNKALKNAYRILKNDGILIIDDFLKPKPKIVKLSFNNEQTRRRFYSFARGYKPRVIKFEELNGNVYLDLVDALEFISKYRSPTLKAWKNELKEAHSFFTLSEYKNSLTTLGFSPLIIKKIPYRSKELWAEIKKDIDFIYEKEYKGVLIVAQK